MQTIVVEQTVMTAVRPSPRVLETAAMFGLGVDESHQLAIVPRLEIPLPHLSGRSGIVFITGPSGSGKSTILRLIGEHLTETTATPSDKLGLSVHPLLIRFDDLPPLEDLPLVDALIGPGMTLKRAMAALSVAGLGEAFVMLRRPCELSDGQRYRLRLAQIISMLMHDDAAALARPSVVLADEFGSTLDRITAQTVARNLRRWVDRHSSRVISFILATAHDDLLEALQPDVLVWKGLGDAVEVLTR